jgi:hypothetical protein
MTGCRDEATNATTELVSPLVLELARHSMLGSQIASFRVKHKKSRKHQHRLVYKVRRLQDQLAAAKRTRVATAPPIAATTVAAPPRAPPGPPAAPKPKELLLVLRFLVGHCLGTRSRRHRLRGRGRHGTHRKDRRLHHLVVWLWGSPK